uniref:MORN repeat-containing protein 5 n=1 Tax=Oncorhynchus tshawytscha TaxID=74940 RepID=A0A8C8FQ14_ONCTS
MEFTGSSYTGGFKNGKYKFPTETRYVGEMKNDMFHGKGVLHFPNGSIYEGTWEKGISKQVCSILCVCGGGLHTCVGLCVCFTLVIVDITSGPL